MLRFPPQNIAGVYSTIAYEIAQLQGVIGTFQKAAKSTEQAAFQVRQMPPSCEGSRTRSSVFASSKHSAQRHLHEST